MGVAFSNTDHLKSIGITLGINPCLAEILRGDEPSGVRYPLKLDVLRYLNLMERGAPLPFVGFWATAKPHGPGLFAGAAREPACLRAGHTDILIREGSGTG